MKYNLEKISRRIKLKKMLSKLIKKIIVLILILLFIINIILLYYDFKNENRIHNIGNIYLFNIVSR